ncbi:LOW QUALITY PROTEIN: dynein axonemal heavy chain 2 [Euwallacea similis]|uniref:LOW QUALITY PROTEIN: dynein axonemal heavy chain 2 n=1 Tax=Euwallacea similis TaxID=1736056 RepID=UPI00344B5757
MSISAEGKIGPSSQGIFDKSHQDEQEKDSLFSSDRSEEKGIKIQTPDVENIIPEDDYDEDELAQLVVFIKDLTILYDLRADDWTSGCEQVIRYWLTTVSEPLLMIFFDGEELTCDTFAPSVSVIDATYFLRLPGKAFSIQSFHDEIIFGTINSSIEGSLLHVIENAYAPVLLQSRNWPDSVKNDFNHSLHMFLAKLTDTHYKLHGLTVLYVPRVVGDIPIEVASEDKEFVKSMESVMVYWIKQVRVGLQDQEQDALEDIRGPIDEYDFWRNRYENLLGLNYQLENETIKHLCNILSTVQSSYVKQFRTLAEEIIHNVEEAKSNIEYLNVLVEPCEKLASLKHPADFPMLFPKILNLIRYIWMKSPYYNTKERISVICRALSNQIIRQCTQFIDTDVIFVKKQSRSAIKMFEFSIQCLTDYIKTYVMVSDCHNKFGEKPWNLDKAPIFNHVDCYIQRCKDMIEICQGMMVFGRHDEAEEIPKPLFGTSKGQQFETWVEKIEKMFNEGLNDIEMVKHRILDVQKTEWYDDILKFRTRMKDIEVVVENLTNAVFDEIANVEEGIESLAALYNYTKRETLLPLFDDKTLQASATTHDDVLITVSVLLLGNKMFQDEILDTKQDIQIEADMYPTTLPYYAGRAQMLKMKKQRLILLKKMFDDAGWMLPCSTSKQIFAQYKKLITSIDSSIVSLYRKWVDSIGEDLNFPLQHFLICKSISKPGLLECNIDRSLLDIFKEAKFWDALNYEIPTHVKAIYQRADNINFIYECVLDVVLDYNKIVSSLSDEERMLFKPLIGNVEKKISPGLSKLTWGTDIGDEYIAECSNSTTELQEFIDDYKQCNLHIVLICEKICDTPLIQLTEYTAMELQDLVDHFSQKMNKALAVLVDYYHKIIEFLMTVFEGFEGVMGAIANQWLRYINNFDKVVEEALKICCKNSLQSMFEALHGDSTSDPNPLIQLEVNLDGNKINFEPSLANVARVISNIQNTLVEAFKSLPRINEKFHVAGTNYIPYSELIRNDNDCKHMQIKLNQEVKAAVEKIKGYVKVWEPFRDLWEVDKDKFMERYEGENPSAALFDTNIGRYSELANNVQIEETVSNVLFFEINSSKMKKTIIDHCTEWQNKMCMLLFNLTERKLNNIYDYMEKNGKEIRRDLENLEDMQLALQLCAQLKEELVSQEEYFPQITEQIRTLEKYSVPIPQEMQAKHQNFPTEWANYLEILQQTERMLGYAKVLLKDRIA